MTVTESELVRAASERGRSASFCGLDDTPALADNHLLMSPQPSARRTQSCRVQGAARPHVRRREDVLPSNVVADEDDSPTALRRSASARKAAVGRNRLARKGAAKKGGPSHDTLDSDAYLLRNFATTTKGNIINRGDSFRRRRSRSNSVQPFGEGQQSTCQILQPLPPIETASPPSSPIQTSLRDVGSPDGVCEVNSYRVAVFGATGVGKTALITQFSTSECINAYDCSATGDEGEQAISIDLNSIESEIVFVNIDSPKAFQAEIQRLEPPEGWVIVYSITDKSSFQRAKEDLEKLHALGILRGRVLVVVANKCELVRSRVVSVDDGRDLACSYGGKFIEVSVGMNHNCDELLVGILNQLRLKEEQQEEIAASGDKDKSPWTRNRSLLRASKKAKRVINRIMGKTEHKYKNVEDFQS